MRPGDARILAIDPGETVGFALFNRGAWDVWEEEYNENTHHIFATALEAMLTPETYIICERFLHLHEFAGRAKISFFAAELIGVVKLVAQNNDHAGLIMQNAAQACGESAFWGDNNKPGGGNAKIKKLKLWRPGKKHGMDAMRHILYYISFTCDDDYYLKLLK